MWNGGKGKATALFYIRACNSLTATVAALAPERAELFDFYVSEDQNALVEGTSYRGQGENPEMIRSATPTSSTL